MFFLTKFLFNPIFIEFFYSQEVLEEIEVIGNYVNELFFTESVKKYLHNDGICTLIKEVSEAFESVILYQEDIEPEHKIYFIDELVLRYDYEEVYEGLQRAKFSPKDETEFLMANLQKDIITSRTRRVNEVKLSNSLRIASYEELENILPETISGRKSDLSEFILGMEAGESKFSEFLKRK